MDDEKVSRETREIVNRELTQHDRDGRNERASGARKAVEDPGAQQRPGTQTYDRFDQPRKPYGLTEPPESSRR